MIELGDNMSKVKKKVRIKKKNFALFIIFIMLFAFAITEIVICIGKIITYPKQEPKKEEKKQITKTNKSEEKTDEIGKNISYYNKDYQSRYQNYKKKNTNLSNEQIIKDVNMNLDQIPYEDIKKARNLNNKKILVNKYYYLSEDYVPDNLETISTQYALSGMKLVKEARQAFEKMFSAAEKEKLKIVAMSSYRSYEYQVNLYNQYVKTDGVEKADTYSGRPGHSEHQTGLAVDVYNVKQSYTNFEKTKEYNWMQENAYKYGFILRFPKEKEKETGYQFESWHYRYVGVEIATYIHEHDISFEEYYATIIKDW